MAIHDNLYLDLETMKAVLGIATTDHEDDTRLMDLIYQVSRWVDAYTGRRFYAVSETRYYTANGPHNVEVDDLLSISALATDDNSDRTYSTAWTVADYDLYPWNALAERVPYNMILTAPAGTKSFPRASRGVKVTGSWGYCDLGDVPGPVIRAVIIQASRLWKREDAPFGIAGPNTFGQAVVMTKLDPDVEELLAFYRRVG